MESIPISIDMCEELGVPGELGGDVIEEHGFFAQTQDQPIGVPIRRVFAEFDPELVSELGNVSSKLYQLYRRFELWLIPHGVSIIRRTGNAEPVAVGIEVKYKNDNRTCSVRSLIPSPKFIEHGHIRGSLTLNGEIENSHLATDDGFTVKDFLGVKFGFRSGGSIALRFDATVITPYISAVGINSSRCEWGFDKHVESLFGRDIQTWAVVALPKRQDELRYDIRFSFSARAFLITRRFQSEWVERVCRLDR